MEVYKVGGDTHRYHDKYLSRISLKIKKGSEIGRDWSGGGKEKQDEEEKEEEKEH